MIDQPFRHQQPDFAALEQKTQETPSATLDNDPSTAVAAATGEPHGAELALQTVSDTTNETAPRESTDTATITGELATGAAATCEVAEIDPAITVEETKEQQTSPRTPDTLTQPSVTAEAELAATSSESTLEQTDPQRVEIDTGSSEEITTEDEAPEPELALPTDDDPSPDPSEASEAHEIADNRPPAKEIEDEKPAAGGSGNSGTPELPVARGGDEESQPDRSGKDLAPSSDVYYEHPRTFRQAKELQGAVEIAEHVVLADLEAGVAAVADASTGYATSDPFPNSTFVEVTLNGYRHFGNINPAYDLAVAHSKLLQIKEAREQGRVIIGEAFSGTGDSEAFGKNYGIYYNDQTSPKSAMELRARLHPDDFSVEYRAAIASFGHVMTKDERECLRTTITNLTIEKGDNPLRDFAAKSILDVFDETSDLSLRQIDRIEDDDLRERAFVTRGLMHIAHGGILANNPLLFTSIEHSLENNVAPFTPDDLMRLTQRTLLEHPELKY